MSGQVNWVTSQYPSVGVVGLTSYNARMINIDQTALWR